MLYTYIYLVCCGPRMGWQWRLSWPPTDRPEPHGKGPQAAATMGPATQKKIDIYIHMLNIYLHTYILDVLWACCRDRTPLPFFWLNGWSPPRRLGCGLWRPNARRPAPLYGGHCLPSAIPQLIKYIYVHTYMYKHMYMLIFFSDTRAIVAAA